MRRNKAKIMAFILVLVMVISGISINPAVISAKEKTTDNNSKVKSITVLKELTLAIGATYIVKATIAPTDAANKSLTFTTANKKVATVSSSGKIKAVAPGETTIKVSTKDGSKISTTIKVIVPKNLTLSKKDLKDGVITVENKTYGNVTIDNSVGDAHINLTKVNVVGTLMLEENAAYTVTLDNSQINNIVLGDIESSKISSNKNTVTAFALDDVRKVPTLLTKGKTKVITVTIVSSFIINQLDKSSIATINVMPQETKELLLSLEGFQGSLGITGATKATVDITVKSCKITDVVAQGKEGQIVNLTDIAGEKETQSSLGTYTIKGQLETVLDVRITELIVDKAAKNTNLTCNEAVAKINNEGFSSKITINTAVTNLVSTGKLVAVVVGKDATIQEVVSQGMQAAFSGEGTITAVTVEGKNTKVDTAGTKVIVGEEVTGTTVSGNPIKAGEEVVVPSPTATATPTPIVTPTPTTTPNTPVTPPTPPTPPTPTATPTVTPTPVIKETVYTSTAKTGKATVTVEGISLTVNDLSNVFLLSGIATNVNHTYIKGSYTIVIGPTVDGYNQIQLKKSDGSKASEAYQVKLDSVSGKITVKGDTSSKIVVTIGGVTLTPTKVSQ